MEIYPHDDAGSDSWEILTAKSDATLQDRNHEKDVTEKEIRISIINHLCITNIPCYQMTKIISILFS